MTAKSRDIETPSRRDFLKATVVGAAAAAVSPEIALAKISEEVAVPNESIEELWAKAVAKAKASNMPIYYDCDNEDSSFELFSINADAKFEGETSISIRPEHVSATVFYKLTDNKKRIEKYRKLVVYATNSELKSKTVDVALADNKRTMIISAHIVLRSNYLGVSQAYRLYIECYYTGKGFMKIEFA